MNKEDVFVDPVYKKEYKIKNIIKRKQYNIVFIEQEDDGKDLDPYYNTIAKIIYDEAIDK